jgi:hypothetical protein
MKKNIILRFLLLKESQLTYILPIILFVLIILSTIVLLGVSIISVILKHNEYIGSNNNNNQNNKYLYYNNKYNTIHEKLNDVGYYNLTKDDIDKLNININFILLKMKEDNKTQSKEYKELIEKFKNLSKKLKC